MEKTQRIVVLFLFCVTSLFAQRIPQSYFKIPELDAEYHNKIDSLNNQLQSAPNDLLTLELLADFYGAHYQWEKALTTYKRLVELAPNNPNYLFKYGGVLGVQAMEVSRIRSLPFVRPMKAAIEKTVELDSKHVEARWVLMELYDELPFFLGGSDSMAHEMIDQIKAISPLEGALAKAYYLSKNQRIAEAIQAYKRAMALALASNNCNSLFDQLHRNQSYYEMGKAFLSTKKSLNLSICCFTLFINQHSSKEGFPVAFAWERLSQAYELKGEFRASELAHQRAVLLLPTVSEDLQKWDGLLDLEIVSFPSK